MSPTPDDQSVMDFIEAGQFIQAIKRHRELTGLGLKESKEYVDNLRFATEMKVLKCKSIDEMKDKINRMLQMDSYQKEFILDIIDESFYLGEDSGHMTGYAKSMEENAISPDVSEDMAAIEEDAYNNGFEDGRSEGQNEGYENAMDEVNEQSYDDGWKDGQIDGLGEGKDIGYNEGYEEGKLEGYEGGLQTGLEQGRSEGQNERIE